MRDDFLLTALIEWPTVPIGRRGDGVDRRHAGKPVVTSRGAGEFDVRGAYSGLGCQKRLSPSWLGNPSLMYFFSLARPLHEPL